MTLAEYYKGEVAIHTMVGEQIINAKLVAADETGIMFYEHDVGAKTNIRFMPYSTIHEIVYFAPAKPVIRRA